jgi:hypothetical protein
MLSVLVAKVSAASISLSPSTAQSIISNSSSLPIFLRLWAPWCSYCRSLIPIWDSLSDDPSISSTVIIADLECNFSEPFCRRFEGTTYPRFFWIDPTVNVTVRYLGKRDLTHFALFTKKQLNFPLALFTSDLSALASEVTLFVFTVPEGDSGVRAVAGSIAARFRHLESYFLTEPGEEFGLHVIVGPEQRKAFVGSVESPEVFDFIRRNSVPFLAALAGEMVTHFEREMIPFFAVVGPAGDLGVVERRIAESVANTFQVVRVDCAEEGWFCRYVSIDVGSNKTEFVVFDRARRLFWVYRSANITEENVVEWAEAVSARKVRPEGPGTGFLGRFREPAFERRAAGEPSLELLPTPVVLAISLIVGVVVLLAASTTAKKPKLD